MSAGGKYNQPVGPKRGVTARGGYQRFSATAYCYLCARAGILEREHRWDEFCPVRDKS